jgi:O-antigen ligase
MGVSAAAVAGRNEVSRDRASSGDSARAVRAAWAGTGLLWLVAPFEASQPLLRLPGQSLSSVEAALIAVFAAWLGASALDRRFPDWRTPLTAPWIAFGLAAFIAASASAYRANAFHMAGRFGLAFGVFVLTVNAATTASRLRGLIAAAAIAGGAVATLVLLEYGNVSPVMEWLRLFRPDVAHVGGQIRAGGPFQYPTIASMYLEIAFALTLGLLLLSLDKRRAGLAVLIGLLLVAMAEAVTLTFTRSGLITIAASLLIAALVRIRRRGVERGAFAILALSVLVAVQFLTSRSLESLRLRMTTEGLEAWYHARIDAPQRLSVPAGGTTTVPVTLRNTGASSWDPAAANRFRLSYHWLLVDADRVVSWEGHRTDFPAAIRPGDSVTLQAKVEAPPQPGEYRLMWDVEQEHRLWFSTEPGAEHVYTVATVSGPRVGTVDRDNLPVLPARAVRPGRFALWSAAARMLAAHPVLGVGPDNFRLSYGSYARLPVADPRVHSNNMYLEVLTGGGIILGLAFLWLLWRAGRGVWTLVAGPAGADVASLTTGVVAAAAAIAIHGLSDSFLSFTGTYVAIAITLGLVVSGCRLTRSQGPSIEHAHRV